jgi:hypothetical protein
MVAPLKFIKDLFNRRQETQVSVTALATLVAPVYPLAHLDNRAASIGKGFEELSDWVRIGFHHETEKGRDATALIITLRQIGEDISRLAKTNGEERTIAISNENLAILRTTYWQMAGAAEGLRMIAKTQSDTPDLRVTIGKDGVKRAFADYSNVIPIYNRPNESHEAAAGKLEEVKRRLDSFFVNSNIRPAAAYNVQRKADFARHYN